MGLRFRKSIKLGGLRINFSKSGIGYSYGVKGLRYTKTANGKDGITASIPGTGISYVEESARKKRKRFINAASCTGAKEKLSNSAGNKSTCRFVRHRICCLLYGAGVGNGHGVVFRRAHGRSELSRSFLSVWSGGGSSWLLAAQGRLTCAE